MGGGWPERRYRDVNRRELLLGARKKSLGLPLTESEGVEVSWQKEDENAVYTEDEGKTNCQKLIKKKKW